MVKNGATLEETIETVSHTLPVCQKRNLAYSTFTIIKITREGQGYVAEFDNPTLFLYGPENSSTLTGKNGQLKVGKSGKAGFKLSREMSW